MAFIGGPRQVGKTTLALALLGPTATERHPAYLNWDDRVLRPGCGVSSCRHTSRF